MAKRKGCGRLALGTLLLFGLMIWGLSGCVEHSSEASHAEEQRRASLTPEQRADEDEKAALERRRSSREADVWLASQEYVRRFLKFPDDADFGFWTMPNVKSNEAGDVFYVSSTVKAKNELGAQLTYRWLTIIAFEGNAGQLVACDIDGVRVYEDEELAAAIKRRERSTPAPEKPDNEETAAHAAQREAAAEAARWRTWTSANRKYSVHAKFIKAMMGTVTLEKEDGSTGEVKLDRLCKEDQEFVRQGKWRVREPREVGPAAKVVRVRIVPYTTPSGARTQMVLVDWRNAGTTTIRAVDADITPYDANGNALQFSARTDKPIYAVSDSDPGIAPGKTYVEPLGRGYIIGGVGEAEAVRVEVKITEVVESGAY